MKTSLLVLLLLTGCATSPDPACKKEGGCLTITNAALVKMAQEAWDDGFKHGYDAGEDHVAPGCMRTL